MSFKRSPSLLRNVLHESRASSAESQCIGQAGSAKMDRYHNARLPSVWFVLLVMEMDSDAAYLSSLFDELLDALRTLSGLPMMRSMMLMMEQQSLVVEVCE